jgi:ribokinase
MKPHIAVVGSINMDLVFKTPRMPLAGETLSGYSFHQIHGGKGANQAVSAARMGAAVTFVACVGEDDFGKSSLQALAHEGIELQHVRSISGCATGVAGILLADDGQNSIVLAPGANALMSEVDIDNASHTIGQAKLLLCQLETPLLTVLHAISCAKKAGVKVLLNPAPAQDLSNEVLSQVDYLVLNETEASQISGLRVEDLLTAQLAAETLQRRGAKLILITLGALGVWVAEANSSYFLPALKVKVVDTTAAGDTFVGSFAVAITEGLNVRAASMLAQTAAALAVTKLGAQTSIPIRNAVDTFCSRDDFNTNINTP